MILGQKTKFDKMCNLSAKKWFCGGVRTQGRYLQ